MFNQAIVRVGIRYGVLSGVACFILVFLLYLIGFNPLANAGRYSFFPIPVFIFLGIKYYKQFNDSELGFLTGLRIGLSVSFYTALTASMLLFLFLYFAGNAVIEDYVLELRDLMEADKEAQIKAFGQEMYDRSYEALNNMSPSLLATYDFVSRFFAGVLFSIVAAVFFRK